MSQAWHVNNPGSILSKYIMISDIALPAMEAVFQRPETIKNGFRIAGKFIFYIFLKTNPLQLATSY